MQENERFTPEICRAAAAEINRKGAASMEKAPAARGFTAADITGRRFGRLAALHPTEKRDKKGSVIWHCHYDCGRDVDVPYNSMVYANQVAVRCEANLKSKEVGLSE